MNHFSSIRRTQLMLSASALIAWQSPALAQTAGVSTTQNAPEDPGQQVYLEEIVVTAQKRTESLQDVPASISVLTGERLEELHANNLTEYASYLPGITAYGTGTPGQTTVVLRGVIPAAGGQTTGTYIDDVPLGSSGNSARAGSFALDLLPYDIDRLEVLRGPQGTLYGASSMGGLIKYALKPADLTDLSLRVGSELSTIEGAGDIGWGLRATANLPVATDVLAVRVSAFRQKTPGYINRVIVTGVGADGVPNAFQRREGDANAVVQTGGRVALQWAVTPDINIKLNGLVQNTKAEGNSGVSSNRDTVEPLGGELDLIRYVREPFRRTVRFGSATLNADLGFATFTSATGYSEYRINQQVDGTLAFLPPGSGLVADFNVRLNTNKFTQEFRLASPSGGEVEWLIGTFYTNEKSTNGQTARILFDSTPTTPFLSPFIDATIPTTFSEYAAFGDLTFRPTPQFDITAGVRLARNKQKYQQVLTQFDANGDFVADAVPSVIAFPGGSKESVVTYMVNARYHISDDLMAYARVASGYRPGGPNAVIPVPPGFPPLPTSFEADELTNYEIGMKGNVARKFQFDFSAYQIDWNNIQTGRSFGPFAATVNAGKVRVQGFEVESVFLAGPGTRFGFNAGYTDAKLAEDLPELGPKGSRLPSIPRWTVALTADQSFDLGNTWKANVGAGLRYVGNRTEPKVVNAPLGIRDIEGLKIPSYVLLDATAGVSDGRWNFSLFARNLTNERAILTGGDRTTGVPGTFFADFSLVQPRTFGISLDTTF